DTGIFEHDRYFDVFVEYAKKAPEEILIQISVVNRGSDSAEIHVLPTLWLRNTWTWWPDASKPFLKQIPGAGGALCVAVQERQLGERFLYCEDAGRLLFTENETNNQRLFGTPNLVNYVKDGINDCVVSGIRSAVNPEQTGTKTAAHCRLLISPGETRTIRLRL